MPWSSGAGGRPPRRSDQAHDLRLCAPARAKDEGGRVSRSGWRRGEHGPHAEPNDLEEPLHRARPSTHSAPPWTSSTSGKALRRAVSSRVASGVVASSSGVTSMEAGSGLRGRCSRTPA